MSGLYTKLAHAVTRWDRMQAQKRGYNPNALAIYLGRVDDVARSVADGMDLTAAIDREFNDRLRDYLIREVLP